MSRSPRGPGGRARRRRLAFGLATVLGLAPRGFFIPYRHAGAVRPARYPALERRFAESEPQAIALLEEIAARGEALLRLRGPAPEPRFDQEWFPRVDAAAAYAMVCRARPRRIVEVGCGHSTRFLARAVRDAGLATRITCIDPAPRAALAGLAVDWRRALVHEVAPETFEQLGAGDILFVDSSHVLVPGSDVDLLINEVLPRLAAGVLVHFHDVFLPDAYPGSWDWRGYNEQCALGALVQGGAFEIAFASHWLATRRPERVETGVLAQLPRPANHLESSLWLVKRAEAGA